MLLQRKSSQQQQLYLIMYEKERRFVILWEYCVISTVGDERELSTPNGAITNNSQTQFIGLETYKQSI